MDLNRYAHIIMQDSISQGQIPAFIPIEGEDGTRLYTITGVITTPLAGLNDGLAAAVMAIFRAYDEAVQAGHNPLY